MARRIPLSVFGAAVLAFTGAVALNTTSIPERASADATRTSQASSSAAPYASKLRHVDRIDLNAESISFRKGSKVVKTTSLKNSSTTLAALTSVLGSPQHVRTSDGDPTVCLPSSTTSMWGSALRAEALSDPAPSGDEVEIRLLVASVKAKDGHTVQLGGPGGTRVGADIDHLITTTDHDDREELGTGSNESWQVMLAHGWKDPDGSSHDNGVSALTLGTKVTVIGSPMPFDASTRC